MRSEKLTNAQKLMRIASAAIAAGGIDALVDNKPENHSMRHIAEVKIFLVLSNFFSTRTI